MTRLQVTITLNIHVDQIRANSSNRNISRPIIHLGLILRSIVNNFLKSVIKYVTERKYEETNKVITKDILKYPQR